MRCQGPRRQRQHPLVARTPCVPGDDEWMLVDQLCCFLLQGKSCRKEKSKKQPQVTSGAEYLAPPSTNGLEEKDKTWHGGTVILDFKVTERTQYAELQGSLCSSLFQVSGELRHHPLWAKA